MSNVYNQNRLNGANGIINQQNSFSSSSGGGGDVDTVNSPSNATQTQASTTEQLILRLCTKLATNSNVNPSKRDQFITSANRYLIKLFSSNTYTPVYDYLEISQKIKKKCK